MYVYICFDVEDLVHPGSDDAARDVAEVLSAEGIVAAMCVVGEKARLWERRGRTDVIAAYARHDVSLHTDQHSIHPVVAEYLADKGWADGVAEAVRQEGPGARDLARIFGVQPSSWGTPGSSWGPHIPAATRQLGIPSNIYSAARSGTTGACWFVGQFCYMDYLYFPGGEDAYCDDAAFAAGLPLLLERIQEGQRRGLSCQGVFAGHPTRFRYLTFWDAANFAHGHNTAPADYRFSPSRDDAAYTTGLRNLQRMAMAVRDLPGVEVISVRALNDYFASGTGSIAWADLRRLEQTTAESASIRADDPLASPAQALDVLASAVIILAEGQANVPSLPLRDVLGPVDLPPALSQPVTISQQAWLTLCRDLVHHSEATGHLPTALAVDGTAVGPGPLLKAMAAAFLNLERGQASTQITLQPGAEEPATAAEFAERAIYKSLPGWPPHPLDLRLDRLALNTRLQAWSLKPAVLKT